MTIMMMIPKMNHIYSKFNNKKNMKIKDFLYINKNEYKYKYV